MPDTTWRVCDYCDGAGYVDKKGKPVFNPFVVPLLLCPKCEGKGEVNAKV